MNKNKISRRKLNECSTTKRIQSKKRDIVIYTICIIICVVALTIVVTMQVLGEGITNKVFHTNKLQIASEEEQLKLRTDFENMFTNKIEGKIENVEKKGRKQRYYIYSL